MPRHLMPGCAELQGSGLGGDEDLCPEELPSLVGEAQGTGDAEQAQVLPASHSLQQLGPPALLCHISSPDHSPEHQTPSPRAPRA